MKTIALTQGKVAWVDDEDYELVSQYNWYYHKAKRNRYGYAITNINISHYTRCSLYMHVLIMNPSEGLIVDHKDCNGTNNQRTNLRICTKTQDIQNRKKFKGNYTSQYKGVSLNKEIDKWRAKIKVNGISISLGYHISEIAAAQMYDLVARMYFGEFAQLNFPENIQ